MIASFVIVFLMLISVLFIATDHRFDFERRLIDKYGVNREWWIPVIALLFSIVLSMVEVSMAIDVVVDKIDIIFLIFSFGILSEGLGASGFFKYLSYKIAKFGKGDKNRLIVYLFIMTSVLTYSTSNDIVILLVTPIVIEICYQAKIRNMVHILLSQFIAANTLSMGLIIGSPTNIIISEELNIDFFEYILIMFVPTLLAFLTSLIIVVLVQNRVSDSSSEYEMPKDNPEPEFTNQMRDWIFIFLLFLILVAIVTYYQMSLFYCAVPSMLVAFFYWEFSNHHDYEISRPLKRLPYGILFFGMSFFIMATSLSETSLMNSVIDIIQHTIDTRNILDPFIWIFTSGIVTNLLNDLPSSMIIADMLSQYEYPDLSTRIILIQSSLIGLNIGSYLTQVGALAGIIWFKQMRNHTSDKSDVSIPTRIELLKYASLHFTIVTLICGIFLYVEWLLLPYLIS